jgi:hypothetical protein
MSAICANVENDKNVENLAENQNTIVLHAALEVLAE